MVWVISRKTDYNLFLEIINNQIVLKSSNRENKSNSLSSSFECVISEPRRKLEKFLDSGLVGKSIEEIFLKIGFIRCMFGETFRNKS
jgi:plasmid rolling circle replication initiator protein Rep